MLSTSTFTNMMMNDNPAAPPYGTRSGFFAKQEVNQKIMLDIPRWDAVPADISNCFFFPRRLFRMLDDIDKRKSFLAHIVSWHPNGCGFIIHKPTEFVDTVMPIYFSTQSKFTSFKRQLHNYGFQRVKKGATGGTDHYMFHHKYFLRDQPELCKGIQLKAKKPASPEDITVPKHGDNLLQELLPNGVWSKATSSTMNATCYASRSHPPTEGERRRTLIHPPYPMERSTTHSTIREEDGDYVLDQVVSELLGDGDSYMTNDPSCSESCSSSALDSSIVESDHSLVGTQGSKRPLLIEHFLAENEWDPNVESLECNGI